MCIDFPYKDESYLGSINLRATALWLAFCCFWVPSFKRSEGKYIPNLIYFILRSTVRYLKICRLTLTHLFRITSNDFTKSKLENILTLFSLQFFPYYLNNDKKIEYMCAPLNRFKPSGILVLSSIQEWNMFHIMFVHYRWLFTFYLLNVWQVYILLITYNMFSYDPFYRYAKWFVYYPKHGYFRKFINKCWNFDLSNT